MRVLIVEDDLKIGQLLQKGFKEAGFNVELAPDGERALDLALAEDYDLIIADVMLPGRDGFSLVEELRRQNRDMPIIFLSAKRSTEDRIEGLQRGGDDYIVKPFSSIELHQKEFALLEVLVRNRERVLTKTQILEKVWKYDFDPQTNVVDVLVHRLRTKIDKDFPRKLIKTIRGVGYAIRSE
jgi:two-component system OmpR family response regulator